MNKPKSPAASAQAPVDVVDEEEVAYLVKRHRLSPNIIREIMRRIGSAERSAVQREITKGQSRR